MFKMNGFLRFKVSVFFVVFFTFYFIQIVKPSKPKRTRDFSADVIAKRDYIFNTIKRVFELYGYQPIETPAMENLSTLLGKYGEEGDRLIFRILNSGDFIENYQKIDKQRLVEAWNQLLLIMSKEGFSFNKFKKIIKSYHQKGDRISELFYNYFYEKLPQIEVYNKKNKII